MEKYFVARKKRRNGKEEGTEMKNGGKKKHENMWILYENLHTQNCLVKIKT